MLQYEGLRSIYRISTVSSCAAQNVKKVLEKSERSPDLNPPKNKKISEIKN
jgi:hypothetical protein